MDEKKRQIGGMVLQALQHYAEPEERVLAAWALLQDAWEQVSRSAAKQLRPIACRRGCAHCCHINVDACWTEAMVLASWVLDEAPWFEPALRREAAFRAGKQPPEIFGRACPFLVAGECAAYLRRPMICRGYQSMDVEACAGGLDAQVPSIEELIIAAQACAGMLERLADNRPADAPLGGELCAMIVREIDRIRAENPDGATMAPEPTA